MERLPDVNAEGVPIIRPMQVREYRQVKRGGHFRWEVLLEWEGLPAEDATWENLEEIRDRFPDLALEDKDILEGDRNVGNEARCLKNAYNWARRAKQKEVSRNEETAGYKYLTCKLTGLSWNIELLLLCKHYFVTA